MIKIKRYTKREDITSIKVRYCNDTLCNKPTCAGCNTQYVYSRLRTIEDYYEMHGIKLSYGLNTIILKEDENPNKIFDIVSTVYRCTKYVIKDKESFKIDIDKIPNNGVVIFDFTNIEWNLNLIKLLSDLLLDVIRMRVNVKFIAICKDQSILRSRIPMVMIYLSHIVLRENSNFTFNITKCDFVDLENGYNTIELADLL